MAPSRLHTLSTWSREVAQHPRLILAVKAAAASALAYYLAPLLPFTDSQYSYYAPLGVLVSLYPTVAGSVRSGVQALVGLAIGIAIGFGGLGLLALGTPQIVTVAAVVGVGVLISGVRRLGTGRDWVAIAGLFVLLLSGSTAGEFSVSYLGNMAFGVVIGVAVNLLVLPPLFLTHAAGRLSVLRDATSARLNDIADAVAEDDIDADRLERSMSDLDDATSSAISDVREADESRRANPRARRRGDEQEMNGRRLRALGRTVFFTRDLADVVTRMGGQAGPLPARDELAHAIRACAELTGTPVGAEPGPDRLSVATTALAAYEGALDNRTDTGVSGLAEDLTAAVCIRRIIDASRPFVE